MRCFAQIGGGGHIRGAAQQKWGSTKAAARRCRTGAEPGRVPSLPMTSRMLYQPRRGMIALVGAVGQTESPKCSIRAVCPGLHLWRLDAFSSTPTALSKRVV